MKPYTTIPILTDGGLETDLIFNHGIELPEFAAFPLLENNAQLKVLMDYYREYLDLAQKNKMGFILESPTWRANLDWGKKLGYDYNSLVKVNELAIKKMYQLKQEYDATVALLRISGQIGPRGDGYTVENVMDCIEAARYHELQIKAFKQSHVDMVTAITMTYSEEALGIVKAAQLYDLPVVISFTVEVDGNLPSGERLEDAILKLDWVTDGYPLYYMINCAHPSHFIHLLEGGGAWKHRIQGIRANASCKSHAELDEATELDKGNKEELGSLHKKMQLLLPGLKVYGGCCGTDISHVTEICNTLGTDCEAVFTESEVLIPINDSLIMTSDKNSQN